MPGYRVNDRLESWIDTRSLSSLRHWQELSEGNRERERKFEIYPGSTYVENDREPQPTVGDGHGETDRIELDDLPPQVRDHFAEVLWPSLAERESMRVWGSRYARLVFERCGGNKSWIAKDEGRLRLFENFYKHRTTTGT